MVSGPSIVSVESCEREDQRGAKRRKKDERKQELVAVALEQIQEALHRGLLVLYTDGSAELLGGVGWVAGYGCHEPGMWEEANHLPVGKKQTINRAEMRFAISKPKFGLCCLEYGFFCCGCLYSCLLYLNDTSYRFLCACAFACGWVWT